MAYYCNGFEGSFKKLISRVDSGVDPELLGDGLARGYTKFKHVVDECRKELWHHSFDDCPRRAFVAPGDSEYDYPRGVFMAQKNPNPGGAKDVAYGSMVLSNWQHTS